MRCIRRSAGVALKECLATAPAYSVIRDTNPYLSLVYDAIQSWSTELQPRIRKSQSERFRT